MLFINENLPLLSTMVQMLSSSTVIKNGVRSTNMLLLKKRDAGIVNPAKAPPHSEEISVQIIAASIGLV